MDYTLHSILSTIHMRQCLNDECKLPLKFKVFNFMMCTCCSNTRSSLLQDDAYCLINELRWQTISHCSQSSGMLGGSGTYLQLCYSIVPHMIIHWCIHLLYLLLLLYTRGRFTKYITIYRKVFCIYYVSCNIGL